MSLFREYVQETRKMEVIETEDGFVSYLVEKDDCYIQDLFIKPMSRRRHKAFDFGDQIKEIAKQRGCKNLITTVNVNFLDPSTSLKGILEYGFKVVSANNNIILAKMEL